MLTLLTLILNNLCLVSPHNSDSPTTCPYQNNNKYSEVSNRWEEYLSAIRAAEASYTPCSPDPSCSSCHDDVIKSDLSPFQSGITRDMMRRAESVTRVTKYQIIDGELFRSEDCMFPFRCSGVEHFLLQLAPHLPNTELVINTRDWPQLHSALHDPAPVFSFSKTNQYLVGSYHRKFVFNAK